MSDMTEILPLIQTEAARLRTDLAALKTSGWLQPSACAAWTVGDVVAHLTQGARTWSASLTRAMAGDAGPPPGEQPLQSGERGSDASAQRAIAYRQSLTADALLQAYTTSYADLQQVLGRLTPAHWPQPCYHRRGTMLVGDYVGLRLQELLVHGWDIRSAFDAAALPGILPPTVLQRMVQRWLTNTFRATPALTAPLRYRFDITAPVPLAHDVVVRSDGMQCLPVATEAADVTFHCATGVYVLLVYGRLSLEAALQTGQMRVSGDQQRAALFPVLFQGL